jgi:hypothetical protein
MGDEVDRIAGILTRRFPQVEIVSDYASTTFKMSGEPIGFMYFHGRGLTLDDDSRRVAYGLASSRLITEYKDRYIELCAEEQDKLLKRIKAMLAE